MLCQCGSGEIKPDLGDCSTSHVGHLPSEAALSQKSNSPTFDYIHGLHRGVYEPAGNHYRIS